MKELVNYNPDVLTCLANLSTDEVFTPPSVANQMLDQLPKELWSDRNVTFLDPVSKSGVFLREIATRLNEGLKQQIPDNQERINHILKNQVFGLAITELTSLLSRRSLYCSKKANSEYSIATAFDNSQGNIRYERFKHSWENGRCVFCRASKEVYEREGELETHAYQFIHSDQPENIFNNMKFDVIIGNPPYQLNDGGGMGTSALPIYNKFVEQAKKMQPRFLSMIIPARWYSGGKGLDEFRDNMLNDSSLRRLVDFPEAADCFPGVQIKGGVCYFLWDRDNKGICTVETSRKGIITSRMDRDLLEEGADTFIRYNEAISILYKIKSKKEEGIHSSISSRKPFGLDSNFSKFKKNPANEFDIKLYRYGDPGYVSRRQLLKGHDLVDQIKVIISKAGSGSDTFPHQILGEPIIAEKGSACTETYIVLGTFKTKKEAESFVSYVKTRFFRFLVALIKNTQNAPKGVYKLVPTQDFSKKWTDQELFKKYKFNKDEIVFIESIVRPME